jgi:MerR family redox-sensitive transcriptional activator SoxR
MVVTQSIGYYIYLVRSRSVGKIMDCKANLMATGELINIREMSERSSVSASTLRYYEKLGLITSERGRSGSHRRYSESTFHRVIYITLAQRAGFSLEEVGEQLAILPNIHPVPPKAFEPLRKKWEQRIDQNIAELKQLKIDLKRCARDASR